MYLRISNIMQVIKKNEVDFPGWVEVYPSKKICWITICEHELTWKIESLQM